MKESSIEFLKSFGKTGKAVKNLSRIENLLAKADDPQNGMKFIHIAGTNGKGSVLEMISEVLIDSGYKTGEFTSPFMIHYNDRIRINGKEIPDEKIDEYCNIIKKMNPSKDSSQFEISFLIALLWFKEEKCDLVVLEAGLGGLLDCTNIIKNPLLSIITSISYDHMAILGNTLEEIAAQKAGIIKDGCTVCISNRLPEEAKKVIKNTAKSKKSLVLEPDSSDFKTKSTGISSAAVLWNGNLIKSPMAGNSQIINIETVITSCKYLSKNLKISDENIKNGIAKARIPGRIQCLRNKKGIPLILDGGHNIEAVTNLANFFKSENPERPITAVIGMINTKDYKTVCEIYNKIFDEVICVDGFAPNSIESKEIAKQFSIPTKCENIEIAFNILEDKSSGTAVICGSFYLVSKFLNEA